MEDIKELKQERENIRKKLTEINEKIYPIEKEIQENELIKKYLGKCFRFINSDGINKWFVFYKPAYVRDGFLYGIRVEIKRDTEVTVNIGEIYVSTLTTKINNETFEKQLEKALSMIRGEMK